MQHRNTIAKYMNKLDAYLLANAMTTFNVLLSDLIMSRGSKDRPYGLRTHDIKWIGELDIIEDNIKDMCILFTPFKRNKQTFVKENRPCEAPVFTGPDILTDNLEIVLIKNINDCQMLKFIVDKTKYFVPLFSLETRNNMMKERHPNRNLTDMEIINDKLQIIFDKIDFIDKDNYDKYLDFVRYTEIYNDSK